MFNWEKGVLMNDAKAYAEILCDFDGTITKSDVVDAFLDTFAGPEWLEIEALWRQKKIGSRECLERQMQCVPPVSGARLREFIDGIEIDPHFLDFARTEKRGRITIVSDGFDIFIKSILDRHKLKGIRYFSNKLVPTVGKAGFKAEFPYYSPDCKMSSGTCKCRVAASLAPNHSFSFIGDGQSDFCVSNHAGIVYAKGKLATYCREQKIPYVEFHSFYDLIVHHATLAV
jgi:2,3-diketo-5-methylthio-1-phosphopentane phosphatase